MINYAGKLVISELEMGKKINMRFVSFKKKVDQNGSQMLIQKVMKKQLFIKMIQYLF